ncbi:MAG: sigma-70 family RNA polymerase sigma factor [Maricaulaceae bacterium]|nr:sigma-70 family RNA polymerase sigma factor [Maricaulaceae bacterium]
MKWLIVQEIPHLRRYAWSLTGNQASADDLVQDCLERALRKHNLWMRRGSLRSWLFRILYRIFVSQRRRKIDRAPKTVLEDAGAALAEPARQFEQAHCRDVVEALQSLPEDQRAAVTLVALEGFAYDEAAKILDAPIGTIRSRLSRGREAIRQMIEGESGGEEGGGARLRRVK